MTRLLLPVAAAATVLAAAGLAVHTARSWQPPPAAPAHRPGPAAAGTPGPDGPEAERPGTDPGPDRQVLVATAIARAQRLLACPTRPVPVRTLLGSRQEAAFTAVTGSPAPQRSQPTQPPQRSPRAVTCGVFTALRAEPTTRGGDDVPVVLLIGWVRPDPTTGFTAGAGEGTGAPAPAAAVVPVVLRVRLHRDRLGALSVLGIW